MIEKKLKVYTSEECEYCDELKDWLFVIGIEFFVIDVDNPINKEEVDKIFSLAGNDVIPIITIKPHLLVPGKSFNTIKEAVELIKSLMK